MSGLSRSLVFCMGVTKPISASLQSAVSELLGELQARSECEKIRLFAATS